jgi:hypothetical protein
MAVPVVGSVVWSRPTDDASIEDPIELIGGLALVGLVGALVLAGVGVLLWPLALAMLTGVVVAFGVANLYVIVLATGRIRQALTLADLRGGLVSSFGLALLEMGGLSLLRTFLSSTFGFTWGL